MGPKGTGGAGASPVPAPRGVRQGHLLGAVGARVAETAAGLEVALAIDAVAADKGAVLPIRPIAALGFTPGEGSEQVAGAPRAPGNLWHPPAPRLRAGRWGCVLPAPFGCCKALEPILGTRKHLSLRAEPLRKHPPSPGGRGRGLAGSLQSHSCASGGSAHPCPPLPAANLQPALFLAGSTGAVHSSPGPAPSPCPPHLPVSNPARVAMGAPAIDVVAGVPIFAGGTELLAALSIEAGRAGLVTLGAVPAGLAGQAAPIRHRARLQALALPAPATAKEGPVTQCSIPKTSRHHSLPSPRCRIRPSRLWALTVSCSLARRSQPGTARGNTSPGSPARTCRSHPPGCTCPCSTGSIGHSGARTSAPGTGSAP